MSAVLVYLILIVNGFVSMALPWIGVVFAYFVAILTPQNIWWWAFEDLRPSFWVTVPALIGVAIATLRGKVDFTRLNTKLNFCVFVLWVSLTIAYYFGPFVHVVNEYRFFEPDWMYSAIQKTFLLYLLAVLVIDDERKIKIAALVIVITTLYMTYWANAQYFFNGQYGRLQGPTPLSGQSIYADENIFAVLFVVGAPFLYYFGEYLGGRLMKWGMLAAILFSWHAVFLTASRGALVGVVAVVLVYSVRARSKLGGMLVVCAFVAAFVLQAGDVMRERSMTITEYETETSASQRIDAWSAATRMMLDHPITGVGLASFGQAFPSYSDGKPKIAHNTFFQIGGEWGVLAGIAYLVLMISTMNRLRKLSAFLKRDLEKGSRAYFLLSEACLLSLIGFFVCSMFLSLENFEVMYYLLALSNCVLLAVERPVLKERVGVRAATSKSLRGLAPIGEKR